MSHNSDYFDNEGVIRCKGRINNTSLPIPAKNPILLPSNHELVCSFMNLIAQLNITGLRTLSRT